MNTEEGRRGRKTRQQAECHNVRKTTRPTVALSRQAGWVV